MNNMDGVIVGNLEQMSIAYGLRRHIIPRDLKHKGWHLHTVAGVGIIASTLSISSLILIDISMKRWETGHQLIKVS